MHKWPKKEFFSNLGREKRIGDQVIKKFFKLLIRFIYQRQVLPISLLVFIYQNDYIYIVASRELQLRGMHGFDSFKSLIMSLSYVLVL